MGCHQSISGNNEATQCVRRVGAAPTHDKKHPPLGFDPCLFILIPFLWASALLRSLSFVFKGNGKRASTFQFVPKLGFEDKQSRHWKIMYTYQLIESLVNHLP